METKGYKKEYKKEYKRIPILKETKIKLANAKNNSEDPTYDDFINTLLTEHGSKDLVFDFHRFRLPSTWIYMHESMGKFLISVDGITWRDITDVIENLKER